MTKHILEAPHRRNLNANMPAISWPPLEEIFWATGFWEGEGSCQRYVVRASQEDREPLDRLQYYFRGTVRQDVRRRNGYISHQWSTCGDDARDFAAKIYPRLSRRRQKFLYDRFLKHHRRKHGDFWLEVHTLN